MADMPETIDVPGLYDCKGCKVVDDLGRWMKYGFVAILSVLALITTITALGFGNAREARAQAVETGRELDQRSALMDVVVERTLNQDQRLKRIEDKLDAAYNLLSRDDGRR